MAWNRQPSLQALVIPSLANEYLAGIRATPAGSEAFLVEPKYSVRMFQTAESAKAGASGSDERPLQEAERNRCGRERAA